MNQSTFKSKSHIHCEFCVKQKTLSESNEADTGVVQALIILREQFSVSTIGHIIPRIKRRTGFEPIGYECMICGPGNFAAQEMKTPRYFFYLKPERVSDVHLMKNIYQGVKNCDGDL